MSISFPLKFTWFELNLQKEVLLLGLVYVKLTRKLRTEVKLVSYMRMAKYKDNKEDRTIRKVLLGQILLLFYPTKLSVPA